MSSRPPQKPTRSLPVRLALLVPHYVSNAWKGIVKARLPGQGAHEVAQAAILDGDQVLLAVRSDLRGWELPGGRVDPGESHEEAAIREVREETGLDVTIERLVGRYQRTGFLPHTAIVFRCRVVGGELTPSDESPRLAWWSCDDLPSTLFPWFRGPLEDALADQAPAVERSGHNGFSEILTGMRIDLRMRISGDEAR